MASRFTSVFKCAVFVVAAFLTSACVTSTDSVFNQKENKSEALITYIQLGLEYIKRGEYERARKHLNRALEIDSDSAGALAALGLVYQKEGEQALAEQHFLRSLEIDPKFTRGRTYYAAYLYSEGRYQASFDQLKLASADTEYEARANVFTNMALSALKLGNKEVAIEAYEKSIRLDRNQPAVILSMVGLLIEDNNYNKAQRYFNAFLGMVRSSGVTHSSTSLYYGILLARHFSDSQLEASYAMLLKNLYSESPEYNKYRQLIADE